MHQIRGGCSGKRIYWQKVTKSILHLPTHFAKMTLRHNFKKLEILRRNRPLLECGICTLGHLHLGFDFLSDLLQVKGFQGDIQL